MAFYTYALRTDKDFEGVRKYVESIDGTTGFAVREVSGAMAWTGLMRRWTS